MQQQIDACNNLQSEEKNIFIQEALNDFNSAGTKNVTAVFTCYESGCHTFCFAYVMGLCSNNKKWLEWLNHFEKGEQ